MSLGDTAARDYEPPRLGEIATTIADMAAHREQLGDVLERLERDGYRESTVRVMVDELLAGIYPKGRAS